MVLDVSCNKAIGNPAESIDSKTISTEVPTFLYNVQIMEELKSLQARK